MQAKAEIYAQLVKACRVLRMAPDADRARAAIDVELELMDSIRTQGLQLPAGPAPAVRRRNRRSAVTVATAAVAGGAA